MALALGSRTRALRAQGSEDPAGLGGKGGWRVLGRLEAPGQGCISVLRSIREGRGKQRSPGSVWFIQHPELSRARGLPATAAKFQPHGFTRTEDQ